MLGQQNYIKCIKTGLEVGLCIRQLPSELVEKDNKPYVELSGFTPAINPLIPRPIVLARNKKERFLIEPSANSCRISMIMKKNDAMDQLIAQKFSKMVAARAQKLEIIRRKPVTMVDTSAIASSVSSGVRTAQKSLNQYDISFLIESKHLERYDKYKLMSIIVELVESLDKDLSEIKINMVTECRVASTFFMRELSDSK